jgi:hypothetical protein
MQQTDHTVLWNIETQQAFAARDLCQNSTNTQCYHFHYKFKEQTDEDEVQ